MNTNQKLTLLLFLAGSSSLFAQIDSLSIDKKVRDIDEVVVSATRSEQKVAELPIQVQVITRDEIEKSNTVRLSQLLNEQTGLLTISDYSGEGIQVQGLDSEYTLIMLDGVPLVGRSAGTLDLNRISVGNVERIEIIKGASSSLYGNEALGGIINIITRNPKKGFSTQLNYKISRFNSHDVSSNVNYKKDKFSMTTFLNYNSSDGYDLNKETFLKTVDPYYSYTINTKLGYQFKPHNELTLSGRYYSQNISAALSPMVESTSIINEWNIVSKYKHEFNKKWNAQLEVYLTNYDAFEDVAQVDNDYKHRLVRAELRNYYKIKPKHNIIGGVGVTNEKLIKSIFDINPVFTSPYFYAQYDAFILPKTNVILGARYDVHSEYKSQFSPKIALKQDITNMLSIRGSVGYGFKTPDFRKLYYDFTNTGVGYTVLGYNVVSTKLPEMETNGLISEILVPIDNFKNNQLKPESSVAYNFGVDFNNKKGFTVNVNFFRNEIKDLINTITIARKTNGLFVYSYENVNKVFTQGVEVNSKYKINNNFTISAGYQLLYAYDKNALEKFRNGEVFAKDAQQSSFKLKESDYFGLYDRSRHMANLKVYYENTDLGLDANLRTIYRGKYGIFDTNSNGYLDRYDEFVKGYITTNLAVHKTLFKNYRVGVGVDNLFNYTNSKYISNIAGRILYGTLNINF